MLPKRLEKDWRCCYKGRRCSTQRFIPIRTISEQSRLPCYVELTSRTLTLASVLICISWEAADPGLTCHLGLACCPILPHAHLHPGVHSSIGSLIHSAEMVLMESPLCASAGQATGNTSEKTQSRPDGGWVTLQWGARLWGQTPRRGPTCLCNLGQAFNP